MSWRTITDFAKQSPTMLRLADRLGRGTGRFRWLDRIGALQPAPLKPNLSDWLNHDLAAVWIGHATILLRIAGMTILTDPVFSHRVGLGMGLFTGGPKRLIAPALTARELPPIDLLLISHAHFDHLDRPSLRQLDKSIPVVTAKRTSDLLSDLGFNSIHELEWGEQTSVGPLSITAHEVNHWGARTFYDSHRGYNAYLIEGAGKRVLYGGDSAHQEHFKLVGEGGPIDLAIVGIGAYNPYIRAHATPEQAWEMATVFAKATAVLPMHHSTFRLSHEPMTEPIQRFLLAAGDQAHRVTIREVGGLWSLP